MNGSVDETSVVSSEGWTIIHIPEKPPVLPHLQATVDVLASAIEPKHANTIVRKLNHIAPLEGLRHVKRIRKTCLDGGKSQLFVILCLASGSDGDSNFVPEDLLELVNTYQYANMLHQQKKNGKNNANCGQLLFIRRPSEFLKILIYGDFTKFRSSKLFSYFSNIDGITGFSEEDSLAVFNFMELAVCMAKSGTSVVNAAVIVDPSTRQVVASSCDSVLPCCAPTENTSRESDSSSQAEGSTEVDATKLENDPILMGKACNEAKLSYKDVCCLYPWGWLEQQSQVGPDSWHPLRHAAIVAIENSAARDRLLFPVSGQSPDFAQEDYKVFSPADSPLKRQKINTNVKHDERMDHHRNGLQCDSTRPYLCTGYDIYFVWEPCIMCAMAIVHQRVRRVFYAFPNPNDGALGSVHRLQGERSLNHHYAVFRVLLPEEILESEAIATTSKID
ncbi:UNVERIFIED_CONTAM: tRNA-specific adenosine deaminase TAD3 [Sesamum radiatum]|uniref:tRNA-specific adenosine deaminase TAD3 n=1 Tax=Sesamum radiatum TaxID=300843 RepID=A0AAW2UF57_SESRA